MVNPESLDLSALPSMPLSDRKQLPNVSCIYFAMSSGVVQYIGRSVNLQRRWSHHHQTKRLEQEANIAWLEISNPALLPQIEAALIRWFEPPLNREFASQSILKIEEPLGSERKGGMKNRINDLIHRLGVTAYRFSEDTGISKTTVYLLKNNPNQFPSGDVFDRIIEKYNVAPNDIVERSKSDEPASK